MTSNIEKGYYENGNLKFEMPYKNGKRDGVEKAYFSNGNINMELPYKNDTWHGEQRIYDISGVLFSKKFCLYGKVVTEDEYKRHILIERLSGINETRS